MKENQRKKETNRKKNKKKKQKGKEEKQQPKGKKEKKKQKKKEEKRRKQKKKKKQRRNKKKNENKEKTKKEKQTLYIQTPDQPPNGGVNVSSRGDEKMNKLASARHSFCRLPLRLPDTPFGGHRSTPLPFADIPALAIAPASLCKRTYGDCTQGWPNKV